MKELNPEIIDINYGCPVKKVANKGGTGIFERYSKNGRND